MARNDVQIFTPGPGQAPLESIHAIPTYLFRLHAPKTVGATSTTVVTPLSHDHDADAQTGLFQLDSREGAQRLSDHLWWKCTPASSCNLMSWSSSLLFALQFGFYRHETDFDRPSFASIHLLVVDTRQFPRGTFIKDLEAIERLRAHTGGLNGLHSWRTADKYFGEYLTQGQVHVAGRCAQTTLQQLIDHGLFQLCPPLMDAAQWDKLVKTVLAIRAGFTDAPQAPTDQKHVRTAILMANRCFGDRWTLPIAAMLLSLQPRPAGHRRIVEGFYGMFADDEIAELKMASLQFDPESSRLPELDLYEKMMKNIYQRYDSVDMVANELAGTTVYPTVSVSRAKIAHRYNRANGNGTNSPNTNGYASRSSGPYFARTNSNGVSSTSSNGYASSSAVSSQESNANGASNGSPSRTNYRRTSAPNTGYNHQRPQQQVYRPDVAANAAANDNIAELMGRMAINR